MKVTALRNKLKIFSFLVLVGGISFSGFGYASFVETVSQVSKSVVAIGLHSPLEHKAPRILGTGFVVGNGNWAITNYHVVDEPLDPQVVQHYVALTGEGNKVEALKVEVVGIDPVHDLALLKLPRQLTPAVLAGNTLLRPGSDIAFTGFPIGAVLGLYPATHRGIVAAITPDVIPVLNSDQLTATMMQRLGKSQLVYQLDATAYPGNSGSPVYHPETGEVVGIINKVFVSQGKESALSTPSGISYAIPVRFVFDLLKQYSNDQ